MSELLIRSGCHRAIPIPAAHRGGSKDTATATPATELERFSFTHAKEAAIPLQNAMKIYTPVLIRSGIQFTTTPVSARIIVSAADVPMVKAIETISIFNERKKPLVFPETNDSEIESNGMSKGASIIPPIITETLSIRIPGVTINVASIRRR